MSFMTSAVVLPIWQILVIFFFMMILLFGLGFTLLMVLGIPECRVLFLASMQNKYVLFNHSSYSTASLYAVKVEDATLSRKSGTGIKIRPKNKDDVERTQKIRWMHSHDLSPYIHSSTTAYIVHKAISEMRAMGLQDTIADIDALFRCKLDETKMIGYIEEMVYSDQVVTGKDGQVVYDTKMASDGTVTETPTLRKVGEYKKYQTQIMSVEHFQKLQELKEKLGKTWVGVDTSGGDIFAFSHLSKVVDCGTAAMPADLDEIVSVAERRAAMKAKKEGKDYVLYAIIFCIICVGAVVLLKGLQVL